MVPIIHFLLSILAGLGVGLHLENKIKKYSLILLLALAATSIDLDHLLPIYHESGIKIFHNFFVFIAFPVTLLLTFYIYEHRKGSTIKQRTCLLLCVMFAGHMFLDSISGDGLPLFYPFRSEMFMTRNIGITIHPTLITLTSDQVIMIFWAVIICLVNLYETLTYNEVECKKPFVLKLRWFRTKNKAKKSWLPTVIGGLSFRKMQIPQSLESCDNTDHEKENMVSNDELIESINNFINSFPD